MIDDPPQADERLDDLPPSCRLVLEVLDRDGELTRQDLLDRTGLPEQTLTWALERLKNHNCISKARNPEDLRQVVYNIKD